MRVIPSPGGPTQYMLAPLNEHLDTPPADEDFARLEKMYGSVLSYKTACITCESRKVFNIRRPDGEIATCACDCKGQWILNLRLKNAGIGLAYQRYSWDDVKTIPQDVLDQVFTYLENLTGLVNSGFGMILWSERTGTGKSFLSTLILKAALSKGYDCYSTSFTEMISQHTASWTDPAQKAWFTRRIQNAGILVIDEIGKENPGRERIVDELLDRVIRERVANSMPTILPTNLNPRAQDDVTQVGKSFARYQAGLMDLLREVSLIIEVPGTSYRDEKAALEYQDVLAKVRRPIVIG